MTTVGTMPLSDGTARHASLIGSEDRLARLVAVAMLTVTAAVHVPLAVQHISEVPYLGVSMYAFVLVAAGLVGLLATSSNTMLWRVVLVLSVVAIATYVVSRTVGLPLASDDIGHWFSTSALLALAAQAILVAVSLSVLRHRHASAARALR